MDHEDIDPETARERRDEREQAERARARAQREPSDARMHEITRRIRLHCRRGRTGVLGWWIEASFYIPPSSRLSSARAIRDYQKFKEDTFK